MNENSQTVDTLFLWSQSAILPNLLMTSCKSTYCQLAHTHIMRPNFELKNANKATIAHTLSLAFLQL